MVFAKDPRMDPLDRHQEGGGIILITSKIASSNRSGMIRRLMSSASLVTISSAFSNLNISS